MNPLQAKEILALYRPGTADADDADFWEALRLCESDRELKRWFDEHCATYAALQAKFKQVPVPQGLKEQILSERKVHATPRWRRPSVFVAVAAVVVVLAALLFVWPPPPEAPPPEASGFPAYLKRMVSVVQRTYGMELETDNLDRIRSFLEQRRATSDYVLPTALQQRAQATGCGRLVWRGQTVSMICFKSGRQLAPGQKSDLWFLVLEGGSIAGAPSAGAPSLAEVNGATTASWTQSKKIYLLVAEGNEEFLRQYL